MTDASGRPFFIIANRVGNFYTHHEFRLPLQRVRVRGPNGRYLEMASPPPHGDCNVCHNRDGGGEGEAEREGGAGEVHGGGG